MGLSIRASFFRSVTLAASAALLMNSVPVLSVAHAQTKAPVPTQQGPESVADLAAGLLDAVVNISTSQKVKNDDQAPMPQVPEGSPFQDFFDEFFKGQGGEGGSRQRTVDSLGSGFVIDASGIIVTNNHVIEGADEITVNFKRLQAQGRADRHGHQDRSRRAEGEPKTSRCRR
jgi:serine protease Do